MRVTCERDGKAHESNTHEADEVFADRFCRNWKMPDTYLLLCGCRDGCDRPAAWHVVKHADRDSVAKSGDFCFEHALAFFRENE